MNLFQLILLLIQTLYIYSTNIYGIHPKLTYLKVCEPRNYPRKMNNGTFLHITDIHIDPAYEPNTDPNQLCHRRNKVNSKNIAGKYGTLGSRCDSPNILVDETFEYLKKGYQDVDFIIYTGDSSRHDRDKVSPRTKQQVLMDHNLVMDYFNNNFNLSKTILIPTIGNNDIVNHNKLEENESIFEILYKIWKPIKHLSIYKDENEKATFLKGGYWLQHFYFSPKIKLININSMYFYIANPKAIDCDKADSPASKMLEWMENKLIWIKQNGFNAYIMTHIPPRDEINNRILLNKCYSRLINIIGKYSDNIVTMFTGHTNSDVLSFISKKENETDKYEFVSLAGSKRPEYTLKLENIVSIMTTGPSITPYNHPAIRHYVYTPYDGSLLGYKQYYANLTVANQNGNSLKYQEEYNTWIHYNLNSFSLDNTRRFIHRLVQEQDLWKLYVKYQSVGSLEYLKYPIPRFKNKN